MPIKNKRRYDGDLVIINVPHKQNDTIVVYELKVTLDQFKIIEDAGVEVIGMFTYANGTMVARGRGKVDGKLKQPMIHKLLDYVTADMDNLLDFTTDKVDLFDIPEPVVELKPKPKVKKEKSEAKTYEEPLDDCSEPAIKGVSWNKRKNKYEAKATHKASKVRKFLGYYQPEHIHVANTAVRDFLAKGMAAYDDIMEKYFTLYPNKRR